MLERKKECKREKENKRVLEPLSNYSVMKMQKCSQDSCKNRTEHDDHEKIFSKIFSKNSNKTSWFLELSKISEQNPNFQKFEKVCR